MSLPQAPNPAKLVIGLFMKDRGLLESLIESLVEEYGQVDMISAWFPFDYTSYYEPEMGAPLFRRMVTFKTLIEQVMLPDIKNQTNEIETTYLNNNKRHVNIDPGYMLLERFVLATGKNFTHRIYMDKGIYADLTLIYQKGTFQKLPWTYPDYTQKDMLTFLHLVRNKYIKDLKG